VIVHAITAYNQGRTLQQASKSVNKKFHVKTYPQLISGWLKEFRQVTPYQRIRRKNGPLPIQEFKKRFQHKQVYEFKYHKQKMEEYLNYFSALRSFLQSIPQKCPDELFQKENARSSQIKIKAAPCIKEKFNQACRLADLALKAEVNNKKRHSAVQDFMLYNDSTTTAIEVPVWLYPEEFRPLSLFKEIKTPITGHIDLVQARYGLIHVLDYKPDAERVSPIPQLFTYALALSKRTGIWLRNFKCAWFNERIYREFTPASIVLENEIIPPSERKQYVLDAEKQLFHEQRMLRERFGR